VSDFESTKSTVAIRKPAPTTSCPSKSCWATPAFVRVNVTSASVLLASSEMWKERMRDRAPTPEFPKMNLPPKLKKTKSLYSKSVSVLK
jgi:hypothetical protein